MSMIFQLRMLSDENDRFIREYEIPCNLTLAGLNDFICDDLHFDRGGITSFFSSSALWEKGREYTREDMSAHTSADADDAPVPMGDIKIDQVIGRIRDRLIFLFDVFGDRCLYIELTASAKPQPEVVYPRVSFSKADPPCQYDVAGSLLLDDLVGEFTDAEIYDTDDFADDF